MWLRREQGYREILDMYASVRLLLCELVRAAVEENWARHRAMMEAGLVPEAIGWTGEEI